MQEIKESFSRLTTLQQQLMIGVLLNKLSQRFFIGSNNIFRLHLKLTTVILGFAALFLPINQPKTLAQTPGSLDMSFGNNGKVITPFENSTSDFAYAAAIQSDGKIVSVGGISGFLLARHNPDGSLDKTFGEGGKVVTRFNNFPSDRALAVAIQADGKILAAGATLTNFYDIAIARYNTDGTLDNSFGNGGKVTTAIGTSDDFARAIAVQSDGKIIAAGFTYNMNEDFALVRYNPDGTLDNSFGTGGKVVTQFDSGGDFLNAIAIQSDGKIVGVGSFGSFMTPARFALVRYNPDGTLDTSFGTNGKVTTAVGDSSSAFAAAIQPDGKIVVAGEGGSANSDFALARYHANGNLDSSFGADGIVTTPITGLSRESAQEVLLQQNGKIVAVGYSYMHGSTTDDFALVRYNADGSLDSSFGIEGKVVTQVRDSYDAAFSAVIQPDGKIVAVGYSVVYDPILNADFALVRYIGDPVVSRRTSFDFDGDGRSDISIFRPAAGEWWYSQSSNDQTSALQFGASADRIVPADFTGDGRTDVAVFRPASGFWFVLRSEDYSFYAFPFGTAGDIPFVGDFDSDGKADPGVFRPSQAVWYISKSSGGVIIKQFGTPDDVPVPADYDGDGTSDIAIFRAGAANGAEWWVERSTAGLFVVQFGLSTDKAVPADYTGDGRTDVAFFRPSDGFWYVLRSEDLTYFAFPFGMVGDLPSPSDYDGDGRADAAVFRPSGGLWFIQRSSGGISITNFGIESDIPVPTAFLP